MPLVGNAGGFALAEAFVRLTPDTTGFRAEADAKLKAAMAGLSPEATIKANTAAVKASIADVRTWLAELSRRTYQARIIADDAGAQAKLSRMYAQLLALNKTISKPKLDLQGIAQAQAALAGLDAQFQALASRVVKMHVSIDDGDFERRLALVMTQLTALSSQAANIRIGVSDASTLARIAALRAAIASLADETVKIQLSGSVRDPATGRFITAAARDALASGQIGDAEQSVRALTSDLASLMKEINDSGGGMSRFARIISAWGPNFRQAGAGILFTWAGIHLVIDGLIEIAAVVVPAMLAFGAFAAAGAASANTVYDHLHNLYDVFLATGKALPPLTGQFAALQNKIQPSVIQLYGEGLMAVNHGFGTFSQLANTASGIIDKFGARLVYDMQHGSGAMKVLLQQAGPDLDKLLQVFGNLMGAVGNLMRALPGFASVFLNIAVAVSKFVDWITKAPTPILYTVLALHGLYLWGGLANQVFLRMTKNLTGIIPFFTNMAGKLGMVKVASSATAEEAFLASLGLDAAAVGAAKAGDAAGAAAGKSKGFIETLKSMFDTSTAAAPGLDVAANRTQQLASKVSSLRSAASNAVGDITNMAVAADMVSKHSADAGTATADLTQHMDKLKAPTSAAAEAFQKSAKGLDVASQAALALNMGFTKAEDGAAKSGFITNAVTKMKGAWSTFLEFMKGPMGPVAVFGVVIAALVSFAFWIGHTKDATDHLVASLNDMVNRAPNEGKLAALGSSLSQMHAAMSKLGPSTTAATVAFRYQGPVMTQAGIDMGKLQQATHQQVQEGKNLLEGAGTIMRMYHVNYPTALAIATLAHVDLSKGINGTTKAQAAAMIQIQALMTGYKDMGVSGGQAASDVLAMQYALKQQDSQIGALNQAWDTYLGTLGGGESALLGFRQQLLSLPALMKAANTHISVSSGRTSLSTTFSQATTAAGKARAALLATTGTITGTNKASLQLQQAWQQLWQSGNQLVDSLRMQGVEGPKLAKVIATVAAEELKYAGNNKTLREEVAGFINQAVAPGTVSLQNMDKWVRHNAGSANFLQQTVQKATGKLTDMSKAAQTLSSTMQQQLSSVMSSTALEASGATDQLKKFTDSLVHNGTASQTTQGYYHQAIKDLMKIGVSYQTAKQWVDGYTKGLGYNASELTGKVHNANSQYIGDMTTVANEIKDHVKPNTDQWRSAYANLMNDIVRTKPDRQTLITDIESVGRQAHLTTGQIAEMIHKITGIPTRKAVHIVEEGLGHFTISTGGSPTHAQQRRSILAHAAHMRAAAGGKVTGGTPGKDSVLGMLMPGEVVVPTHMVKAGAVDHLKGKLPGFAGGGFVGNYSGNFGPAFQNLAPNFDQAFTQQFTSSMESAMTSSMRNAIAQAMVFAAGPARYGGSSAAMSFARSMLGSYGWGGQWPALYDLWMRESGWNPYAVNPTSGAMGIPQALGHGNVFALGDYANQIRWGLSYIAGRYGSPDAAWAHETAYGWYAKGGLVKPHHVGGAHTLGELFRYWETHYRKWISEHSPYNHLHGAALENYWQRHWGRYITDQLGPGHGGSPHGGHHGHHGLRLPRYTKAMARADEAMSDRLLSQAIRATGMPMMKFDSGGWLPPGASIAVNATGRPEKVLPPSAGSRDIILRFEPGTEGDLTRALMTTLRKRVRVEGGGNVQSALGTGSYV